LAEGIIAITRRALMQQRPRPNNDSRSIANAAVQNQKSECTGSNTRSGWEFLIRCQV
jgi:hypothetical protein